MLKIVEIFHVVIYKWSLNTSACCFQLSDGPTASTCWCSGDCNHGNTGDPEQSSCVNPNQDQDLDWTEPWAQHRHHMKEIYFSSVLVWYSDNMNPAGSFVLHPVVSPVLLQQLYNSLTHTPFTLWMVCVCGCVCVCVCFKKRLPELPKMLNHYTGLKLIQTEGQNKTKPWEGLRQKLNPLKTFNNRNVSDFHFIRMKVS